MIYLTVFYAADYTGLNVALMKVDHRFRVRRREGILHDPTRRVHVPLHDHLVRQRARIPRPLHGQRSATVERCVQGL